MIYVLLAIFWCCTLVGVAQSLPEAPNLRDHLGLKTGRWVDQLSGTTFCAYERSEHPFDCIYYRIAYYDRGEPVGAFQSYYLSGSPMMKGNYKQKVEKSKVIALLHGSYVTYHPNGLA